MEQIKQRLREFSEERNWDQFHSPKNLSMALAGEVGELMDIFQWLQEDETTLDKISDKDLEKTKHEIADIQIYLIRLADKLNIDLLEEANKKIDINSKKYPVELSRNTAVKYNRRNI